MSAHDVTTPLGCQDEGRAERRLESGSAWKSRFERGALRRFSRRVAVQQVFEQRQKGDFVGAQARDPR